VHIEQVDFLSIPTRDVARAVAFYRDVLGLPASEFSEGEVETGERPSTLSNPSAIGIEFAPIRRTSRSESPTSRRPRELEAKGVEFAATSATSVCA
jgi:catechol 2,3-dioxygenase-like lactoylglutathione lyase family enzyme